MYETLADVIFNKLYTVRVPVIATYSSDELDVVGIPVNVVDGVELDVHNELTTVMITINKMVDIFKNGYPIRVLGDNNVLEIYNTINDHIKVWDNYRGMSLNANYRPDDDLVDLDNLANEIFNNSKVRIIDHDLSKPAFYDVDTGVKFMGVKEKVIKNIDYDNITRDGVQKVTTRRSKYDINKLLI